MYSLLNFCGLAKWFKYMYINQFDEVNFAREKTKKYINVNFIIKNMVFC